jgi:hypothetical protein
MNGHALYLISDPLRGVKFEIRHTHSSAGCAESPAQGATNPMRTPCNHDDCALQIHLIFLLRLR